MRINAPNGVLTEELRAQIAERKAEILDCLTAGPGLLPPIPRRSTKGAVPLSFAQERLWFLDQLNPHTSVYNLCRAWRIRGSLKVVALENSMTELLWRHQVLRSAICVIDGRPMQVVRPSKQGSGTGETEYYRATRKLHRRIRIQEKRIDEGDIQRHIQNESAYPFDFAKGSFLRASLLRVAADDHVLILTTHHIVSDAWSMGILTREFWTLYERFANNETHSLPELALEYSDFVLWQRQWLQGEILDSQLSYWKKELHDLRPLNLPTDRVRPAKQSFRGSRVKLRLAESLTRGVNELSGANDSTPFMTLLAAFQVLLYRYSDQDDIVVGTPVANRTRTELEPLIGFFVNTLVLRSDLSGTPSFSELLRRVREVCLGAFEYQDIPYDKIVAELNPERDQSRNSLFQVMFVLQNATRPFGGPTGLRVAPIEPETGRSQFDLSLVLRERDRKYVGFIEYSTDLFDRDRIERMSGHFKTLLEAIIANPEQSISTLPILTESERQQVLVDWNDTAAEYPKDKCIHHLFEEQVERTPDAIALRFQSAQLTYAELNRRANILANRLIQLGVGPDKLVGIYMERSIEMVIGLLGILKAGGGYLPLDPIYPRERLLFVLADSRVSLLVARKTAQENSAWLSIEKRQDEKASAIHRPEIVYVDCDLPIVDQCNDRNPVTDVAPDNVAYVVYTSGSTGEPKGVLGTHRATVNRCSWMWKTFPFAVDDTCCAKTPLSFVDSVWETFGALLAGVKTTLIPEDVAKDILQLVQLLEAEKITRIVLVPSLLEAILNAVPKIHWRLRNLDLWISSGESLSIQLADRFRKCFPGKKLLNLYGSSEVAADATCFDCHDRAPGSRMRIGKPIQNTRVYILDAHSNFVPIGIAGELYIGGIGVARGYLNRPELTAVKFVKDPFSNQRDSRLYRSGDFGRYLVDGNIEFLGRSDHQVKVRGNRIELGEIESALRCNSEIKECWATVQRGGLFRSEQIVVYIVPTIPRTCSIGTLREFLASILPHFMMPSRFVIIDHLPLMWNGKVDRDALPKLEAIREQESGLVAPRTGIEEVLQQLWREFFNCDQIGIHDNFFELGGHSLTAAQLLDHLNVAFVKPMSLGMFFEEPTIAGLAKRLRASIETRDDHVPPIISVSRKGPTAISVAQEPFFMVDQLIGGAAFFNMPYAYRLEGPLNVSALNRAITEITRRQLNLRATFKEVNGRPVQSIGPLQRIRVPVSDLSKMPSAQKNKRLMRISRSDAQRRFNLRAGPVFRVKLIRLEEEKHILLVTMHHIVTDHWSMGVFRAELEACYRAFAEKKGSTLPELPLQFVDFVRWQQRSLKQGRFQEQLRYWKKQLAKPLAAINFGRSTIKRGKIRFRSARQPLEIDSDDFEKIKLFSRSEGCTSFMLFVTALTILLHLITEEKDIRIATLVANRGRPGTEGIIGYFVNLLVLRNHVDSKMIIRELLQQVRKVCLAAYLRQDLPFEALESALQKQGIKNPLAQVMLNYRNFPMPPRETAGLTVAPWSGQIRSRAPGLMVSRLDMIIHLRDTTTKLTGAVNYKTDLLTEDQVRKIVDGFRNLAVHLPNAPDVPISSFRTYVKQ